MLQALLLTALLVQQPLLDQYLAAQKAYAANPRSEEHLLTLANLLVEKAQVERAVALLTPFVRANPTAVRAKTLLASSFVHEEKYDSALTLAGQAIEKMPKYHYAHHVMGLALFGLNRFQDAAAQFKLALEFKPDFAETHFRLGLLYARNPETLGESASSFKRALELGHPKAEIYKNVAAIKLKQQQYSEAVAQLNMAVSENPNYADAYFLLADALRKSGRPEDAAEAMRHFQALNGTLTDRRARANKSQALYEEGMGLLFARDMSFQPQNFARAYAAFTGAVQELPELDAAHYRLAQIDFLVNNPKRAEGHIRRAVELNPFEPEYYFVLASSLRDVDVRAALDAAAKAVSLNPQVGDFQNLLGILLEKSGDHVRAVQSYRKATELDPANEAFKANLAAALRKTPE
jgi:protein O-GlcNAc transferase